MRTERPDEIIHQTQGIGNFQYPQWILWVATHTCASLLITTERSFKESHDLPIWDVAAHGIITL